MKNAGAVLFLTAIIGLGTTVLAGDTEQGWGFTMLAASTGEDALSSGLAFDLRLAKNKQFADLALRQKQGWVTWGRTFERRRLSGEFAGAVGHFLGEPWVGPYAYEEFAVVENVSISSLQWPLLVAREPEPWRSDDRPNDAAVPWLLYLDVSLHAGPLSVTYSNMKVFNDPRIHCFGGSFTHKIKKDFSIKVSATHFRQQDPADPTRTEKRMMYLIQGKWSK